MIDKLQAWTYQQQRLGRNAEDANSALHDVIAVYSSHPTAPLSLLSRSRSFDAATFSAMEQRREVVRIPAMRNSIFLVPTATATRLYTATRQPVEKFERNLHYAGLDWDTYARLKQEVLEFAQTPKTTNTLQETIKTDGKLMTAVRLMCYEGLMLRVAAPSSSLRSDSLLYVATEAWLAHRLDEEDPVQALSWLAEEYLRCYGPAHIADFAWWSGVTRRRAAAAFSTIETIEVEGGLLLLSSQQSDFGHVEPIDPEAIDLLPKWDAYTMGYAPDGRQRLLDDAHLSLAYSNSSTPGKGGTSGDGLPLLLRGGRAIASWSHRFEGNRMQVKIALFGGDKLQSGLDARAFDAVGELLGATCVEIDCR
jgi:Winged helix DNA-binding domain